MFPDVRNFGHGSYGTNYRVLRMNVISLQVHHFYCIISEIKKRVILQQTIYMYILNNEELEILLWGERLLYSQISPGGKATI